MNSPSSRLRLSRIVPAFCFCTLFSLNCIAGNTTEPAQAEQADRPHLKHQSEKMETYSLEKDSDPADLPDTKSPNRFCVAPGLYLPTKGHVWALDKYAGNPELVHVKFTAVDLNNHTASNLLKQQAAPFIYKPKKTIEIKGGASAVRLHETSPTIL
jgi:hypothetical protein